MENYFVHETAVIDDGAIIGNGSKIWHWVHISAKATIGKNVSIGQNVFVADNVQIGNNVKIQNNVSLYEGLKIEDDVFIGPSAVFTNVFNPRSFIERKDEYRFTLIGKGASLGANCTIVCGNEIGSYAFVGAGAVVTKNIPSFALFAGVPAVHIGWISKKGHRLDIPLEGQEGKIKCPISGDIYKFEKSKLLLIEES
tara:strand:- start:391 stop:981 length:591 start_codon:yes stop_codon:yes gene_type:complete